MDQQKLEDFRINSCRGNDKAVENIGSVEEKEKLKSIIENPADSSRQELMEAIIKTYSGEAYGEYQWSKQVSGWDDSPDKDSLFYKFNNDYPHLKQLSLHPGFITKLSYFFENIEKIKPKHKTSNEVLEYMNKDLGDVSVYRGMALTEEELETIMKIGILSNINRTEHTKESVDHFEGLYLSTKYKDMVEGHVARDYAPSPIISVTAESETASVVARESKRDSNKIYVFKILIPALDQIHYSDHGIQMSDIISSRGPDWEKDRESFVFWKINPDEIVGVSQVE